MGGGVERKAYLLAGPTASGKSAIAATLAREMGAWILSADSMLVYKGMDIGTAKPPPEEIAEFHMGGVDVVTPAEEFSSGAWLRAAAEWAERVPRDVPVVIVGGTGLNLTGADMVMHYDPWWNPAVEDQATDRAHRIGQRKTVYVMKMIASGSIEEKVLALQRRKQAVIAATVDASDAAVMESLTAADLAELLG